jgi:phage I-like protein
MTDPAKLIRVTNERMRQALPVDYEHQSEYAPQNGQPAPAAGWIKELQPRPDGIWGRIEWTERAANHIAAREYRFISPVFTFNAATGEVSHLVSAGLTNTPNLELTALARAQYGETMDELEELQQLLGLSATAQLSDVVDAVRTLVADKAANRPDPTRFVPMEIFEKAMTELNARNQGMAEDLAMNHVEAQIRTGRVFPFLREWAVALCKTDRPAFDAFVDKTGPKLQKMLVADFGLDVRPPTNVNRLSEIDAQIARSLGHSEKEFIAANRSRIS